MLATMTAMSSMNALNAKAPGTIGAYFESLSAKDSAPLPERFAKLKRSLVATKEDELQLVAGWKRLLAELKVKNPIWAQKGPAVRSLRLLSTGSALTDTHRIFPLFRTTILSAETIRLLLRAPFLSAETSSSKAL